MGIFGKFWASKKNRPFVPVNGKKIPTSWLNSGPPPPGALGVPLAKSGSCSKCSTPLWGGYWESLSNGLTPNMGLDKPFMY